MRMGFVALFLCAACAPEITEGHFACAADSDCPSDWTCRADLRCWREPGSVDGSAGLDGGSGDGGSGDGGSGDGGSGDGGVDGGPTDGGFDACIPAPADVDLLIMVDNSGSMFEEQTALAAAFPELIAGLVNGDVDGDLLADFQPIDSLHIGVVSSDMGTGPVTVPTCTESGDDGLLIGTPRADGCAGSHAPPFIGYLPGASLSTLNDDVSCLAQLGTLGCGFEQQLDAVLKALTPRDSTVRFRDGQLGHGGSGANAGFLREGSLLVTLLVTDEEDCSTANTEVFNPSSSIYTEDLNLRCTAHPEALFPVSRYVDGLLALRSDPSQLVFAAVVGVPVDLQGMPLPDVLADDRMSYRINPDMTSQLLPACERAGATTAVPGRRFLEVADGLETRGAHALARSICEANFNNTVTALLETMSPALQARCL